MEKETLLELVDNQEQGVVVLNKDLVVLYANNKVKDFFLSDINNLLGNYLKCNYTILEGVDCQHTSNCEKCMINNSIRIANENHSEKTVENIRFNSDGKYINISLKISFINEYTILEFIDLCELYKEVNFLSRMIDKSKDIMFFKDDSLKYRYVNERCAELLNKEKQEILNKDDIELARDDIEEDLYKKLKRGDLCTLKEGHYSEVLRFNERYLHITKENIEGGILCIARDITNEVEANERAETDFLTKLSNVRKFIYTIDEILANKKEDYYLALIDLDNLRNLNNCLGHLTGDKYLIKLGEILASNNEGSFFRIGGDEFAGLIHGDIHKVKYVFDNIFYDLKNLDYNPPLSISVGIKKIDTNKRYIQNYNEVDKVLYRVKENGKGTYLIV